MKKTKTKPKTKTKTRVNPAAKAVKNLNLILAKSRLTGCLTPEIEQFLALCAKLEITRIQWYFCGSGDSGDVDDINFVTKDHHLKDAAIHKYIPSNSSGHIQFEKSKCWTGDHEVLEGLCRDFVFDHFVSDKISIDWYNDDGGFGEASFDCETGEFKIEASAYHKVVGETETKKVNLLEEIMLETSSN